MDEKVEALSNLIDKIVKKEILLPDFQRKFIWKEEEKQGRLIASVLAKMPIGSILLLDSDAKDYAYKMLGCRERKTYKELEMDGKILALLDGQQRVTVLTNAFSNVIFDMAKTVVNFYCFENNIWVYICKILITSVVCFSAGLLLEINIKDSKNGNKVISAVLLAITLMAAIMGISYITFENVNTYDDNPVETKRYQLNISNDVKISIDDDIENQMMIHGYTVSASDNGETKPYVEIVRHAPEIPKDNVKDIYEDLEFDVYIKNNKLYIKSKRKNKMYLILSNDVFLGNYTNIFNHNINSYNTDVENYCFSSYEVNVYLPEKNIEQEESVGWD